MRYRKSALAALAATMLALASLSPVAAKPPEQCAAEVEKYCQGVARGAGRVFKCLQEYQSQLSPACQQAMSEHRQRGEKARARPRRPSWASTCMGDIKELCQGIPAGTGRIAECLKQHEAELSIACRNVFPPKAAQ